MKIVKSNLLNPMFTYQNKQINVHILVNYNLILYIFDINSEYPTNILHFYIYISLQAII